MAIISSVQKAVELLADSQLVGLPTETVYGLGGNALDPMAVASIFEAKQRPSFDPLIVHVHAVEAATQLAEVNGIAERLFRVFSPGPLTLVLPKKDIVPDIVTSGHPTVAVRIPGHPVMLEVLERLNMPVAAPSANLFGFTSPTTAGHVETQLGEKIAAVLDGGPCSVGVESTIVDVSGEEPVVLRLGGIAVEALEQELGRKLKVRTSSSNPKAPGMLLAHYNPGTKVVLAQNKEAAIEHLKNDSQSVALTFGEDAWCSHPKLNLSPKGNLNEAAANLFSYLRELGQSGYTKIVALTLPNSGLGRAINDRLLRASAKS
jgi:L-threonylcarbamoyladenylate synthase